MKEKKLTGQSERTIERREGGRKKSLSVGRMEGEEGGRKEGRK